MGWCQFSGQFSGTVTRFLFKWGRVDLILFIWNSTTRQMDENYRETLSWLGDQSGLFKFQIGFVDFKF